LKIPLLKQTKPVSKTGLNTNISQKRFKHSFEHFIVVVFFFKTNEPTNISQKRFNLIVGETNELFQKHF
jgi:hypothetical protein